MMQTWMLKKRQLFFQVDGTNSDASQQNLSFLSWWHKPERLTKKTKLFFQVSDGETNVNAQQQNLFSDLMMQMWKLDFKILPAVPNHLCLFRMGWGGDDPFPLFQHVSIELREHWKGQEIQRGDQTVWNVPLGTAAIIVLTILLLKWSEPLMRDHPYVRPPWWETALLRDHSHERPSWWKDCPYERPPWCEMICWETALMTDRPDERPSWLETTLMRDHPDERLPWWDTALKRDHPDKRLPWWETALMRHRPEERPPW